jgi:hypothetical protein
VSNVCAATQLSCVPCTKFIKWSQNEKVMSIRLVSSPKLHM